MRIGFDAPRPALDLASGSPAWPQGLCSHEPAVRRRTAAAVTELDRWGAEAVPTLIPLLQDPDATVRKAARQALADICPVIPAATRKALRDKDVKVRWEAMTHNYAEPRPLEQVEADARNGKLKDECFLFWMEQLKDENPDLRWGGANAMGGDGLHTKEEMSALIEATRDPCAKVRAMAANALGRFGVEGRPAIPALLICLTDKESDVRRFAGFALGEIDPTDKRVFTALIRTLQSKDQNELAVQAIGRCGSQAKEAVPLLLAALQDKNLDGLPGRALIFRGGIVSALGQLGPQASPAVPALVTIVRDRSFGTSLRYQAIRALGEIGTEAGQAIPDLEQASKDGYPLDSIATEAIQRIRND